MASQPWMHQACRRSWGHPPALATGLHRPPASSSGVAAAPKQATVTSPHPVSTHLESLPARSTHHNDLIVMAENSFEKSDPVRRRWLCAHWIDGLSITAIASLEGIDRRTLQRLLNDSLRDLRRQAARHERDPAAKPQAWPGLQPRPSANH